MNLDIHERDVTSTVCQKCAACCNIRIKVDGTDSRYRSFLRAVGLTVIPSAKEGMSDCCDKKHEITIDLGPCKHLVEHRSQDSKSYSCGLYGTPSFPQMCKDYNCVSWAKAANGYSLSSDILVAAQVALDKTRNVVK